MNLRPALLLVLALAGTAGAAEPLEDAAYEAMVACGVVGALTLEQCGDNVNRSAAHSAARKAMIRMFNARTAFMRTCQATDRYPADCPSMAEYQMLGGFNRAVNEEWRARGLK